MLGLASCCLAAVDMERLAGNERCSLEVEDRIDDVADLTDASQRVEGLHPLVGSRVLAGCTVNQVERSEPLAVVQATNSTDRSASPVAKASSPRLDRPLPIGRLLGQCAQAAQLDQAARSIGVVGHKA